ncbi:MAG: DUF4250 domain-containing protein [Clostridia bacterium]|nr:DUF4250 domain-containing protein [Clostridia bacterium]
MDNLPQDDFILLSLVNTRLRDGQSLSDFCADYRADENVLIQRLLRAGYAYDAEQNRFARG